MIDRRTVLLGSVAAPLAVEQGGSRPRPVAARRGGQPDLVGEIEGWRVRVQAPPAARDTQLCRDALRMVQSQLYYIVRAVPPRAVQALRQIEIRLSLTGGENPRQAGRSTDAHALAVDLGEARAFLDATQQRPWSVFHALVLVYYPTGLSARNHAAVAAAHSAAAAAGKYDRALGMQGEYHRHPGLAGPAEYFAAVSTALFGTSDHRPFVAAQLREIDPRGYELVARIWTRGLASRIK